MGRGIGVWNWGFGCYFTDAKCKDKRKKNKVSAKLKSRPRQILLGNFLATCTILTYFFDSEQLFGESATLKVSTFWAFFTIFNYIHK